MLLVWGATRLFGFYHKMSKISIHAPRVGERPQEPPQRPTVTTFQSTLPVWGATRTLCYRLRVQLFQSTLPAGGERRNHRGQSR